MHEFDLTDPDQRNEAAAEYVLGTMERDEKARFESLLAVSRDLQQEVEQWREHLDVFNRNLEPVEPPKELWKAIEQQTAPKKSGFLGLNWGWAAAFCLMLALSGGLLTNQWQQSSQLQDHYVYLIKNDQQKPGWMVNTSFENNQIVVQNLRPVSMPADQFYELWLMPEGEEPISLGFLPSEGEMRIPVKAEWRERLLHCELVVTMEGPQGAPNGYDMGPVSDKANWLQF